MYRPVRTCLVLLGLASASFVTQAKAQDFLVDRLNEGSEKVIQLKNTIETEVKETAAEVSSRSQRLATNPLAELSAAETSSRTGKPQVAFDEIGTNQPVAPFATAPQLTTRSSFAQAQSDAPKVGGEFIPAAKTGKAFEAPRVYVEKNEPVVENRKTAPVSSFAGASFTEAKPEALISAPMGRNESAPFVTTSVSAPEFVNVNEVAKVKIDVNNRGEAIVQDVRLVASVPGNVKVDSRQAEVEAGQCVFNIASLKPGENRQLTLEVVTTDKQPLNIETALTISNRNNLRVAVRQPELSVSVKGPEQTNIGSKATHVITVTNTGDGVARNVNLIADIPESLRMIQKSGFESPQVLRPGQKAQATIVTAPLTAGQSELAFAARGTHCESGPAEAALRITQPELRVAAIGPDMNFVERDGIYTITVNNPGEVDVNNVEVQFIIPEGVSVTTISRQAQMDAQERALTWKFDRVEAQTEETIQLKAVASNEGEKRCRIRIASDETNEKEVALTTLIATRAELSIQMQNVGGPVQVGNEATFVVVVENRGSSVANDMEIEVQLPSGMRPASQSDGVADEDANSILFADSELSPGKTREFKFTAVGVEKGEHVVRSALQSPGSMQRIVVENSVFVYQPAQARVSEKLQPTVAR